MALRKLIYVNENGQYTELDSAQDSIKLKELEIGAKVLTEAKLSKLLDGADASDEHIHDARYFRQDQHVAVRDEEATAVPVITDGDGFIDNSFINPSIAGELSHSELQDLGADDHLQYLNRDGSRPMTADLNLDGFKMVNLADPTDYHHAANKAYVDAVATGLMPKGNVVVATTANIAGTYNNGMDGVGATITLDDIGELIIDGVTLALGERLLVKDQTNPIQNGIYVVTEPGNLVDTAPIITRSADQDNSPLQEVVNGVFIPKVMSGTVNAGKPFVLISIGTGTDGRHELGTDAINWDEFTSPAQLQPGNGISFDGSNISVRLKAAGGLEFESGEIKVKPSDLSGEGLLASGQTLVLDWSTTFDDNKAIKAADLSSTATGKGASIIGIEDADSYFTATDVEGALKEIHEALDEAGGVKYIASGGITKGNLVISTGNELASVYSDITVDSPVLGVSYSTVADTALMKAVNTDFVLTGVLTGAIAGTRYFWDGSALVTAMPATAGANVYQVGIAKNATDLTVNVKFIKKNSL